MATVGGDPVAALNLNDRELVHQAYLDLVLFEGQGIDPNAGIRKYYLYRAWYLRNWANRVLQQYKDELYQKVCVEFDYCARVAKQGKNAELLLGLLDLVMLILGAITVALLAWMLKKNVFDRLCGCSKA